MKMTLSPIVQDVNGKIGDLSFYDLNGQHVARTLREEQPTASAALQLVHAAYGRLVEQWRSLPAYNINTYDILEAERALSSWNLFVEQNLALELGGSIPHLVISNYDYKPIEMITAGPAGSPQAMWFHWVDKSYSSLEYINVLGREQGTNEWVSYSLNTHKSDTLNKSVIGLKSSTWYDWCVYNGKPGSWWSSCDTFAAQSSA